MVFMLFLGITLSFAIRLIAKKNCGKATFEKIYYIITVKDMESLLADIQIL